MKVSKLIVCSIAISLGSLTVFVGPTFGWEDPCKAYTCTSQVDCTQVGCSYCVGNETCRT